LLHPLLVGVHGDYGNINPAALQVNKEQDVVGPATTGVAGNNTAAPIGQDRTSSRWSGARSLCYMHFNNAWWAWFDGQWMGSFPDTEWGNSYKKGAILQWFGEVASMNGIPPKTQMGTGVLPPAPAAAHLFGLCSNDATTWKCTNRDPSLNRTKPQYYDIKRMGFSDTRYGGPGQ
jgi:Neprosin